MLSCLKSLVQNLSDSSQVQNLVDVPLAAGAPSVPAAADALSMSPRLSHSQNSGTCVSLNLLCGYVALAIMQPLTSAWTVFPTFPPTPASVSSLSCYQSTPCPPDKLLHIPQEPA